MPGTIPLQLKRPSPGYEQANFFLILGLAVGWAVAAGTVFFIRLAPHRDQLKAIHKYEFRAEWASRLTAAGAILGTILSAGLLPEDTFFMSREQYTLLNVVFGLCILFAGILHNLLQKAWVFVVATALTLGAAAGELLTVLLLLEEMGYAGAIPTVGVFIIQTLLVVASFSVTIIVGRKVHQNVTDPERTQSPSL